MRGITLIEMILYCGLFSLLLTGACTSAALIGDSANRTHLYAQQLQERIYQEDASTSVALILGTP